MWPYLSLSYISLCVNQLLENTRTHTSLLTKQVATFLKMNTSIRSTQDTKREDLLVFTQEHLELRTLLLETVKIGHKNALVIMFL